MITSDMTLEQLLEAIELYFECELSDEQEQQLRRVIASTGFAHPAIDEARALMGFRTPQSCSQQMDAPASKSLPQEAPVVLKRSRWRSLTAGLSIAAALAVVMTLGWMLNRTASQVNPAASTCVAYVNGAMVTDEDVVMALMAQSTSELNEAAESAQQTFIDELEMIAPAVDRYESSVNPLEI